MARSCFGNAVTIAADAIVGHDVILGDFVAVEHGACISGYVTVGEHTKIGIEAVIVNGTPNRLLRIGKNVRIADNAVVFKDVPDNVEVRGNPARPMRRTKS